ncbi:pimeloyl-ACP methyl ester carboxylesterase [Nocardia tenerifensis]|uniref:Pimeloyl-ACP methyl ester carboxylesterase n=1 Tax=Nocardia tenerifensis TaxID=228006 RepID=A0A318K6Q5_9NOCA|nr:alpha/beta hydrolase [Nocardia tenerifensis]PXX68374.1 pimeloyl-ACP methyl ester carboxylesterase [Nocardia tenerifensis]
MTKSTLAGTLDVAEGALRHGMPYLAMGTGRPLVFLRWFTPDHANPRGWMRESELKMLAPLARHFRVYAVNRAPGMAEGTTMADIAAEHADALRAEFGEPVDVLGVSSGGSVALQLAADHPAAVRRLVIVSSGYRLDPLAKEGQIRYGEAAFAGRRALHLMAPTTVSSPLLARAAGAALWLIDPLARPRNPVDTLAFVRAEDGFDLSDRLGEITAPTLVIGGERDAAYSLENFRYTADGIPNSRLLIYPGTGHMGVPKHSRFPRDVTDFLTADAPLAR